MTPITFRKAFVLGVALCCLTACEKKEKATPAAALSATPAASAPKAPEVPWFVGTWVGKYEAERQALDASKHEAIAGWQADDGGLGAGAGKLELSVDNKGSVSGQSSGALGTLTLTGELSDQTLRVQLVPESKEPAQAFQGFFVAQKTGDKLEGFLHASTGDGNLVRKGAVSLSKKPD